MEPQFLNHLDHFGRDCGSLYISTNRFLDGTPTVRQPPLLFRRKYLGVTNQTSYCDYDQLTSGNIRYYSGKMRSPLMHYSKDLGVWEDVYPQRYWLSGWSHQMDYDTVWKAALIDDYQRYLNRHEYH